MTVSPFLMLLFATVLVYAAMHAYLYHRLVRAWAVHKWPEVELFSVYAVMAAVLIMRPKGLFAVPEARKI